MCTRVRIDALDYGTCSYCCGPFRCLKSRDIDVPSKGFPGFANCQFYSFNSSCKNVMCASKNRSWLNRYITSTFVLKPSPQPEEPAGTQFENTVCLFVCLFGKLF